MVFFCILSNTVSAAEFSASYKWCYPYFRTTSPAVELKNVPKGTVEIEMTIIDQYNSKVHLSTKFEYQKQKTFECGSLANVWNDLRYPAGHCGSGIQHTYVLHTKSIDKAANIISETEFQRGCPE